MRYTVPYRHFTPQNTQNLAFQKKSLLLFLVTLPLMQWSVNEMSLLQSSLSLLLSDMVNRGNILKNLMIYIILL